MWDKALMAVYLLMPPSRLTDYQYMVITDADGLKNIDDDSNYIVMKNTRPVKMIFNNYKTAGSFGVQKFNIC